MRDKNTAREVIFLGHRIKVVKVGRAKHRVYCDGNPFSHLEWSNPEYALRDAIRRVKAIDARIQEVTK